MKKTVIALVLVGLAITASAQQRPKPMPTGTTTTAPAPSTRPAALPPDAPQDELEDRTNAQAVVSGESRPGPTVYPLIPDAERIIIHFGTSTKYGCIYSFSNCIWIGWEEHPGGKWLAIQSAKGEGVRKYFGQYYPLTADSVLDDGRVILSGFYPVTDTAPGTLVTFDPAIRMPLASLLNPGNPQDNLGNLHTLGVQEILSSEDLANLQASDTDPSRVHEIAWDRAIELLASAGVPLSQAERDWVQGFDFSKDPSDYSARLSESRLTQNDRDVLSSVLRLGSSLHIASPEELSHFVDVMTNLEKRLVAQGALDDPDLLLGAVAVFKYGRYQFAWRSFAFPEEAGAYSSAVPKPVWAGTLGFVLGGPAAGIAATAVAQWEARPRP